MCKLSTLPGSIYLSDMHYILTTVKRKIRSSVAARVITNNAPLFEGLGIFFLRFKKGRRVQERKSSTILEKCINHLLQIFLYLIVELKKKNLAIEIDHILDIFERNSLLK